MNIKAIVSIALLGPLLSVTTSAQQVLSYVASTPGVSDPSGSFTNWTKILQVPAFDASLGTLTQVKLSYAGEVLQSAKGENLGSAASSYDYTISTTLTVAKGVSPTLFAPSPITFSGSGDNAAFDGTFDFGGTSGFTFTQTLGGADELIYINPSDLAQYIGSGMLDFTATANAASSVTGSGQFVSQTISKASAGLTIEYTYTAIPEPATYAMFCGLAGLLGALRHRQLSRRERRSV